MFAEINAKYQNVANSVAAVVTPYVQCPFNICTVHSSNCMAWPLLLAAALFASNKHTRNKTVCISKCWAVVNARLIAFRQRSVEHEFDLIPRFSGDTEQKKTEKYKQDIA